MSTFLISYIIAAILAGAVMTYITWKGVWGKGDEPLTLGWIFFCLFVTLCPMVNYLTAVIGTGWFVFDESGKIVVGGRRR